MAVFLFYVAAIFTVAALIAFAADHMPEQLAEDFARIMGASLSDEPIDDDPERKQADHEWWDRRKALEEGNA